MRSNEECCRQRNPEEEVGTGKETSSFSVRKGRLGLPPLASGSGCHLTGNIGGHSTCKMQARFHHISLSQLPESTGIFCWTHIVSVCICITSSKGTEEPCKLLLSLLCQMTDQN